MATVQVAELAEVARTALESGRVEEGLTSYAEATRTARAELETTDPLRIALAAEHAQAWFDHRDDPAAALRIATLAYEEAVADIDDAGEHQDAVSRLGGLRDQMTYYAFRMA